MTAEQMRVAKQIARQLDKLAAIADENELKLGSGGEIGSMLGAIAADLEVQVKAGR